MAVLDLVALGLDVGGTATRALVVDVRGERRGAGRSGGGNPVAHRDGAWAGAVSAAIAQALARSGPVQVGAVVAGVAGAGALSRGGLAATFEQVIRAQARCSCPIELATDLEVAFAAGTPEGDGTVLVAGTGAAAAAIRDHVAVRVVDGNGWLLGDAGSAFWIGRRAVQAVLADLDGRGPATALRPLAAGHLLGRDADGLDARQTCQAIVQAVHARPPVELSAFAPAVTRCAAEGDQVARRIAEAAAGELIAAVQAVRPPGETTPVAVTGGVAAGEHLTAGLVRHQLEARWPGCARRVHEGVTGAAWLALRSLLAAGPEPAAGHPEPAAAHPEPAAGHPEPAAGERELAELHRALVQPQQVGPSTVGND